MSTPFSRRQFLMMPVLAGAVRFDGVLRTLIPRGPVTHPDPRPGITSEKVLSAAAYAKEVRKLEKDDARYEKVLKKVTLAYEHAREIPEVLDGLLCFCGCDSYGHRSLLSCYEVVQAVGCWSCKDEAELAYKLHREGKSLDEIRAAVDRKFGD